MHTAHSNENNDNEIIPSDGKESQTLDWSRLFPEFHSRDNRGQTTCNTLDIRAELLILEHDENELARELRSYCTLYGKEKKQCLVKSASVLLKLAEVYLRKAEREKGNARKLSYIRCCALLNAAFVRLKDMHVTDKVNKAELLYESLSHSLLKTCHSCFDSTNLLHVSKTIFDHVSQTRREISQFLQTNLARNIENSKNNGGSVSMEILKTLAVSKGLSTTDFEAILSQGDENSERKIIQNVKKLNKITSSHYKSIMTDIADRCINLIGIAPCNFAIVGLGSLSRQEITLYSDFEHIILLEEHIESWENYHDVIEYFRWFSVLFQVIIIGFGETILPSVQVPSLNDSYSGKADKDWFYDEYTPRGISFDGMLPHSCKIPLGRQQATPKRPHAVELIQTPRNMAKYLSKEEHLKNGYYLDEVLRQTCLVYGDEDCYKSFVKERNIIVQEQLPQLQEQHRKLIQENVNCYVQDADFSMNELTEFDTKTVLYRPLVTRLWFLSRIYGIDFDTTFDAIEGLREFEAITQVLHHKLSYAVATACEVRTKIYHRARQQKCKVQLKDLYEIIGEDTLHTCKDMITYLEESSPEQLASASSKSEVKISLAALNQLYVTPTVLTLLRDLFDRKFYEEAAALGEKLRPSTDTDNVLIVEHDHLMLFIYNHAGLFTPNRREYYHEKAEELFFRLISNQGISLRTKMNLTFNFGQICKMQQRYSDYMWALGSFLAMHRVLRKPGQFQRDYVDVYREYHDSAPVVLDIHSAKRHLQESLWKENFNRDCELIQRLFLCTNELIYTSNENNGLREKLASISADVKRSLMKLTRPYMLLMMISLHQIQSWWLEDAIETLDFLLEIPKPSSRCEEIQFEQANLQALKVLCLCRLGQQDKVMKDYTNLATKYNNRVHDIVLEILVSMLWKKLHWSRDIGVDELGRQPIIIIYWLIDICFVKKRRDIFLTHAVVQHPTALLVHSSAATLSFSRGFGMLAVSTGSEPTHFALLFLCNAMPDLAEQTLINNFVKSHQIPMPTLKDRPTFDYRRFESNNRGTNSIPSIFPPPWIHFDL